MRLLTLSRKGVHHQCPCPQLQARGVEILEPPASQSWGHRTLFFRDPENNVLEIYADI